jgi:hypothetical protein
MGKVATVLTLLAGLHVFVDAAEKYVSGEVTYVTSSSVYTSLGRNSGITDSSSLFAVSGRDTFAVLRVQALSSNSSVCRIETRKREVSVGDRIVGSVLIAEPKTEPSAGTPLVAGTIATPSEPSYPATAGRTTGDFEVTGRISGQFFGTFQNEPSYNISQPGVVTKLNVRSTEIPIALDLYANFRNAFYGPDGISSGQVRNQSRIHRLVVDYEDSRYRVSVGRFAPAFIASIGYIDGVMFSASTGRFSIGAAGGFQPAPTQRGMSTDYKKLALFTNYFPGGAAGNRITLAYSRTYYVSELDREATSLSASFALNSSFSLYAHSDFDMRQKEGDTFVLSPRLSQMFLNIRYRVIQSIGLGIGGNATRPLYPYSTLKTLPAEFVDNDLRGGLSFSVYLYLPEGISLSNSYTPRTSRTGFADNYTEYATLTVPNIASSGVVIRTNFNMNANDYTDAKGYGVHLFRNMWQAFDITVRYQEYNSTVRQLNQTTNSSTIGADLLIPFSRMFSVMGTFERLESPGIQTNTVFAELTVRF